MAKYGIVVELLAGNGGYTNRVSEWRKYSENQCLGRFREKKGSVTVGG